MTLTARQREIILTVGREGSQIRAAHSLGIALSTLKNELLTIRRKLGVRSTTAALYLVMHESEVAAEDAIWMYGTWSPPCGNPDCHYFGAAASHCTCCEVAA